ncbi:Uma2 family endonuclease [Saccharopolyspora shandongensis]|uniref:Uma2 family endonuclease n=1 Tax=Saccharopolyspora shandongensis TaxID=418495 RepID=UPI0033EF03B4
MTRAIATLSGAVSTVCDDIDTGGDRTMTAAPAYMASVEDELFEVWESLDLPNKGWRAEIIEGRIVMTPPPGNEHNLIASRVHRALARAIAEDWQIFQTAAVDTGFGNNLYVPDLVVIPQDQVIAHGAYLDASNALLVVEITSASNADVDRTTKLRGYAHAGIPLYLLIDRFAKDQPAVTLHSRPSNDRYWDQRRVPFGEPISIPEPFDLTLETKDF